MADIAIYLPSPNGDETLERFDISGHSNPDKVLTKVRDIAKQAGSNAETGWSGVPHEMWLKVNANADEWLAYQAYIKAKAITDQYEATRPPAPAPPATD